MTWPNSRPGTRSSESQSFCEPLWLPSWSDRSVWGYDEPTGSYFAQLWRDEDAGTDPTAWISGVDPVRSVRQLATFIAEETGRDMVTVVRAMLGEHADDNAWKSTLGRPARIFPAE